MTTATAGRPRLRPYIPPVPSLTIACRDRSTGRHPSPVDSRDTESTDWSPTRKTLSGHRRSVLHILVRRTAGNVVARAARGGGERGFGGLRTAIRRRIRGAKTRFSPAVLRGPRRRFDRDTSPSRSRGRPSSPRPVGIVSFTIRNYTSIRTRPSYHAISRDRRGGRTVSSRRLDRRSPGVTAIAAFVYSPFGTFRSAGTE